MVKIPSFFGEMYGYHFEHSFINQKLVCLVAAGKHAASHEWLRKFPWAMSWGHVALRKTWIDFVCGGLSGNSSIRLSEVSPNFHHQFDPHFEEKFDLKQMQEEMLAFQYGIPVERERHNPMEMGARGLSQLYLDLVAEDALRSGDYDLCIESAERKLNILAGEWDRLAVFHILKACL